MEITRVGREEGESWLVHTANVSVPNMPKWWEEKGQQSIS